jgi:pimeloyl-ACP methyl ester carboxylesterase
MYDRGGERRDRKRLTRIGRAVDIGGRTLNIFCSGEGAPAVVFDSGNGAPGYAWSHIQPRVAAITRACWYDRAGDGWSDPGPFPRTSAAMAADLHELLRRAGVPPPYVLVGHSLGGLNVRVYNGLYPSEVAGAVLVDAAHEDEPRRAPAFMRGHTAPRWLRRPIWIAGQMARAVGLLRLTSPRVTMPDDPAARTRDQIVRALASRPQSSANHFDSSVSDSYGQAERSAGFGDRPVVVLTRGRMPVLPANPSEEDRQYAAYENAWMHEIQPKLARLSSRGRQVIVANSGHGIPDEAPDAVVAAVRDVIDQIRNAAPNLQSAK